MPVLGECEELFALPFSNAYGGLSVVRGPDGQHWFCMGDEMSCHYIGPLTDQHLAAANLLRDLDEPE